jgi:crossover junction endodeoxyribonuclease RuvC
LSSDKEAARALALRLFPACAEHFRLKKHHGRAEAALIAKFGAETICPAKAGGQWSKDG